MHGRELRNRFKGFVENTYSIWNSRQSLLPSLVDVQVSLLTYLSRFLVVSDRFTFSHKPIFIRDMEGIDSLIHYEAVPSSFQYNSNFSADESILKACILVAIDREVPEGVSIHPSP